MWFEISFQITNLATISSIRRWELGKKNRPKSLIWEQYVPFTDVTSEQNGTECPIVNNFFHLQVGMRNKTVLNYQFGNNEIHLQIGA